MIPGRRDDVTKAVCQFEEARREAPIHRVEPGSEDVIQADSVVRLNERGGGVNLENGGIGAVENRETSAALLPLEKQDPEGVDVRQDDNGKDATVN